MTHSYLLTHPLRKLDIGAFFPGLILSIVDASVSGAVRIAGISVLIVSAIVSTLLLLYKRRNPEASHPSFKVPILLLIYDVLLASGTLVFLIFTWIWLGDPWRAPGRAVLTAYASISYLLIFLIHAYLAILNLIGLIDRPRTCPHCDGQYSRVSPPAAAFVPSHDSQGGEYRNFHEFDEQQLDLGSIDSESDDDTNGSEDTRLIRDEEARIAYIDKVLPDPLLASEKDEIKVLVA